MFQSVFDQNIARRIKGESETIEYLDLSSGFLGPHELINLSKCIQVYQQNHNGAQSLIEIDISSNQLCGVNSRGEGNYDPDGLNLLATVLQTSRVLKSLCLDRNFLSVPGCVAIGTLLLNQNSISNLSLKSCKISNEGAVELAKGLLSNRSLSHLDLSGNVITTTGLRSIFKSLNDNRRSELKYLDLSGNGIEYEGCQYLTSFLKDNNSLRALLLDDNSLGGSVGGGGDETGIHLFANILPNLKKLGHLSLQNNQISDQILSKLAKSLETNRTLSYLGLQWNMITSIGGTYLAKGLSKNSTLLFVGLVGNHIPPPTAGFIVECSLLVRGNVLPPCELDIPSQNVRSREISLLELEAVQYEP